MGACHVDLTEKGRQYSVQYALNDSTGVKSLLRDRHRIASRRFSGDTDASCILLDLHSAIESAALTERQAEAIGLVYGKWELTLEEAGGILGCTKQGAKSFVDGAAQRIAAVYQRWEYGTVTVELEAEANGDE